MSLEREFLAFIAVLVLATIFIAGRFITSRYRLFAIVVILAWTAGSALFGLSGALSSVSSRPPGILYIFVATAVLVAFAARSRIGVAISVSIPFVLFSAIQSMRAVVELTLHELWTVHRLPTILTFQGGNLDIVIGLSAPVVALLYATGRLDIRIAAAWNILGLFLLANVVARAVLTSPMVHVVETDAPSAIGSFPYSFIPTLVVPLAVTLHVLSLRQIDAMMRS